MDNYIAEIIREYLTKRYPGETEAKIRSWLVNEEYAEDKNEALSAYWDLLHVDPDIFVYESLEQVKALLTQSPPDTQVQEFIQQEVGIPAIVEEAGQEEQKENTEEKEENISEEPLTEKIDYPSDIPTIPIPDKLLTTVVQKSEEVEEVSTPPVIMLSPSDVVDVPVYEVPANPVKPVKNSSGMSREENTIRPVIQLREPEPVKEPVSPDKAEEAKKEKILFPEELIEDEKNANPFYWGKIVAVFIPFLFILAGAVFFLTRQEKTETIVNITVPYGETNRIELQDGSVVWLNSGSTLSYPQEFLSKERKVQLSGEGFFSIIKDSKKPFKVQTTSFTVEVLGTEFNVMAYPGEEKASTTLTSGKIKVETVTKETYELDPAQQLSYDVKSAETMIRTVTPDTEPDWTSGHILFRDASLKEMLRILERRLNVKFQVDESLLADDKIYTVKFVNNENIEDILNILQEMVDFSWKEENQVFYLKIK